MKNYIVWIVAVTGFAFANVNVQATEPLAFQGVMKNLGKHMQTIAGAIALEDWELVEKTAPLIGAHPQPPAEEKARIFSFIGSNMDKFKAIDMETHEAAHELQHAAHAKDGQQVIVAYQKLQSACLGCHQAFRKPFVAHFYGKQ
ncbi:MAG: cytochrome c [Gallionellaceae bacterium]|jgi:cytochrome c556